MSRSGYCEDLDHWEMIKWRGQVASAIRGKRGQACLREMLAALDAMPVKELIAGELEQDGEVCALGALGKARGVDMTTLDPEDPDGVAVVFGIAPQLAREIVYENDEHPDRTPADRWKRMRKWIVSRLETDSPRAATPGQHETKDAQ